MDLVERAAALIGATAAPQRRLEPAGDLHGARRMDRLEHAVADAVAPRAQAGHAEPQKRPEASGVDDAVRPEARRITVDLDVLRAQRVITPAESRTMMTESFRRVKRHIVANINAATRPRMNLVMITSSLPGEGKTFCSVNLAISLAAEVDRTVLLVDADLSNSCVPSALGITADMPRGFIDLVADSSLDFSEVLYKTNLGKLVLLPAGAPRAHSTELLAGDATAHLLQQMAERYEDRIVIFDSAPLLVASESCALAAHMGQIVLVVEAGKTTEKTVQQALSRIESCNVAGVLLNKGAPSGAHAAYGYGYGSAK